MRSRNESPLIMVADRDKIERAQLKAVLKLRGYRVIEAATGAQVIELALAHRSDLLVLDLKLPRLRSSEAMWLIRREPALRKMPVIAVSNQFNGHGKIPLDPLTVQASRPIEFTWLDVYVNQFLPQARSFAA